MAASLRGEEVTSVGLALTLGPLSVECPHTGRGCRKVRGASPTPTAVPAPAAASEGTPHRLVCTPQLTRSTDFQSTG